MPKHNPNNSRVVNEYVFSLFNNFLDAYPIGCKILLSSGCSRYVPKPVSDNASVVKNTFLVS